MKKHEILEEVIKLQFSIEEIPSNNGFIKLLKTGGSQRIRNTLQSNDNKLLKTGESQRIRNTLQSNDNKLFRYADETMVIEC